MTQLHIAQFNCPSQSALPSDRLTVSLPDAPRTLTVPAAWLWDMAEENRDPISGQRLTGVLDRPADLTLTQADIDADHIRIRFRGHGADLHVPLSHLHALVQPCIPDGSDPRLWPDSSAVAALPVHDHHAFLNDDAVTLAALDQVASVGFARLSGGPLLPGTLEALIQRFGYLRETNYGRLFDVRVEPSAQNLAFTARGLEGHTDNPYRDPVPTLQLLYSLENDTQGGETLLCDGFAQAGQLAAEDFAILRDTAVLFRFCPPDGAVLESRKPLLSCDAEGKLSAIHLNHRSLYHIPLIDAPLEAWIQAYTRLVSLCETPSHQLDLKIAPGETLIFDNTRLLHSRKAFHATGRRWLQGAYADRDGLLATRARLHHTQAQARA